MKMFNNAATALVEKSFSAVENDGVKEGTKTFLHGCKPVLILAAIVGGTIAVYKIGSNCIDTCLKSKTKRKEQEEASALKKDEINLSHNCNMDELDKQTDGRVKVQQDKKEIDKELIILREKLRRERMEIKNENSESGGMTIIEDFHTANYHGHISTEGTRYLGFPWLKMGYTTGLAGPTDIGKSTLLIQIATSIAKGKCEIPMCADWQLDAPTHVIYISLEQSYEEIQEHYGDSVKGTEGFLHLYCGQYSPDQISQIVITAVKKFGSEGVVLFLDNYTKLREYSTDKEIRNMDHKLDTLVQTGQRSGKPMATLKIFHTNAMYDESKKFETKYIRGDKAIVCCTNDFVFFTKCKLGEDKRILGYLKGKHIDKSRVHVLEYANTKVDQYRYVCDALEKDVLCPKSRPLPQEAIPTLFYPTKKGRKPTITLELAQQLQDQVTRGEKTWREIEQETGHKKSKIKERLRSNRKA